MNRRELIKTGIAAGISMGLPGRELFAQDAPLVQKKIPSSGELIPIIDWVPRGVTKTSRATRIKCRCVRPSLSSKLSA